MLRGKARIVFLDARRMSGLVVLLWLTLASVGWAANQVASITRFYPRTVGASRIARHGEESGTAVWLVRFSGSVENVSVEDFELESSGSATGRIASITAGEAEEAVYYVTVDQLAGVGWLRLQLRDGTDIRCTDDSINAPEAFSAGQIYALGAQVYGFGYNYSWQLGNYSTSTTTAVQQDSPVLVEGGSEDFFGKAVVALAATNTRSFAVTEQGEVYGWGANSDGWLGTNDSLAAKNPRRIAGLTGVRIVQVAANEKHALALSDTGKIYAWGTNASGRLGDGSTAASQQPVEVFTGATFVAIAAGYDHSLAVTAEGRLYSWGENGYGQLGTNSTTDRSVPDPVYGHYGAEPGALSGKKVVAIAAGTRCSFAVTDDGLLYAWGYNYLGQLGNGLIAGNTLVPQPVQRDPAGSGDLGEIALVAGSEVYNNGTLYGYFTLALAADGTPYAWGDAPSVSYGNRLGTGSAAADVTRAKEMLPLSIRPIVRVSAGGFHSLALDSNHVAYSCGRGEFGSLGSGVTGSSFELTPVDISGVLFGKDVVDVCAGSMHSLVLAVAAEPPLKVSAMTVPAAGNYRGTGQKLTFTVTYPKDVTVSTSNGTPFIGLVIGANQRKAVYKSLTAGRTLTFEYEVQADDVDEDGVQYIDAAGPAIRLNGGTVRDAVSLTPADVRLTKGLSDIYLVDAPVVTGVSPAAGPVGGDILVTIQGANFTGATEVLFGGRAVEIQPESVSDNSITVRAPPGAQPGSVEIVVRKRTADSTPDLADSRDNFTYAEAPTVLSIRRLAPIAATVARGGTVKWLVTFSTYVESVGPEDFELQPSGTASGAIDGIARYPDDLSQDCQQYVVTAKDVDGTGTLRLIVRTNASIEDLAGGPLASGFGRGPVYAIGARAFAFGLNGSGELGDNSTTLKSSPIMVQPGSDGFGDHAVVAIDGAWGRSFAVAEDGQLYGWGRNASYYLGVGDAAAGATNPQKLPKRVVGLSGVTTVSAGHDHTLAITGDGRVHAWGLNGSGRLGLGDTTNRATPVPLFASFGGSRVVAVSAGFDHSLALTEDGRVYAWGENNEYQLGTGDQIDNWTPTAVRTDNHLKNKRVVAIAAGFKSSYALTADGQVCAWGRNDFGQLGFGETSTSYTSLPRFVQSAPGVPLSGVIAISAGKIYNNGSQNFGFSARAVTADGTLYAWGRNDYGQSVTGLSDAHFIWPTPMDKGDIGAQLVETIAAGAWHCVALAENGTAFTGGRGQEGALGNGSTATPVTRFTPVVTSGVLKDRVVVASAAGGCHTLLLAVGDAAAPHAKSVMAVPGNYRGIAIDLKVTYDVPVTVTGTPTIALRIAGVSRVASYQPALSTATELVFRYVTAPSDNGQVEIDKDAMWVNLAGGKIVSQSSGDPAVRLLPNNLTDVYVVDPPIVTGVTLNTGPLSGNIRVTIRGAHFDGVNAVLFGDRSAVIDPASASDTRVTVVAPPAASPGTVEVVVGKPGASSTADVTDTRNDFTYCAQPFVRSVRRFNPVSPAIREGAMVKWLVTFSSPVDGVDPADFELKFSGAVAGSIESVAGREEGKCTEYIVTARTTGAQGTWRLNVLGNGGILDADEHELVLPYAGEQIYAAGAKVYTFGANADGQLGTGIATTSYLPESVKGSSEEGGEESERFDAQSIVSIAASQNRSFAVTASGRLYAWGRNRSQWLGVGSTVTQQKNPAKVVGLDAFKVVAVYAGWEQAFALVEDDAGVRSVYAWGRNENGQLGLGPSDKTNRTEPTPIYGFSGGQGDGALAGRKVVAIAGGHHHTLALTDEGKVYAWGENSTGQLGLAPNSTADCYVPAAVFGHGVGQEGGLSGKRVVSIAAGIRSSFAVTEEGEVYAWGDGVNGQLGTGSQTDQKVPVRVADAEGAPLADIMAIDAARPAPSDDLRYLSAGFSGMALAADGTAYSWGCNHNLSLGLGSGVAANALIVNPSAMIWAAPGARIDAISRGATHSVVVTDKGELYTCGYSILRGIGSGATNAHTLGPVEQNGLLNGKSVLAVAAGTLHTVVLAVSTVPPPSIKTFSVPAPGNYRGGTLQFKVWYDTDKITVTSTATDKPYISIYVGENDRQAAYVGKDSTDGALVFEYKPEPDELDADGVVLMERKIILPDGTAIYHSENRDPAELTLPPEPLLEGVFIDDPPEVLSVGPVGSPLNRSVAVTIRGRNLANANAVLFGEAEAEILWVTDTAIGVKAPESAEAKIVDVVVCKSGARSSNATEDRRNDFTYGGSPIVVSVKRYEPLATSVGQGATVTWLVTFSTDVTGVDEGDFELTPAGVVRGTITGVINYPGDGNYRYLVIVETVGKAGTVRLDVRGDGTVLDTADAAFAGRFEGGELYAVGAKAYAFGNNAQGELGNGNTTRSFTAVPVNDSPLAGESIVSVEGGHARSFAITDAGKLFAWGANDSLRLGIGIASPGSQQKTPAQVKGLLDGQRIKAVSAGWRHTLALTEDGKVFAWGENESGQLGAGENDRSDRTEPTAVYGHGEAQAGGLIGKTVVAISAGLSHSLALTSDGQVYAWGENSSGQLGTMPTSTADSGKPVPVYGYDGPSQVGGSLYGKRVVAIAAGTNCSFALTDEGRVYAWGANTYGQLGVGAAVKVPKLVVDGHGEPLRDIVAIAATDPLSDGRYVSGYSAMALAADGIAYSWGYNQYVKLGNGAALNASVNHPTAMLWKSEPHHIAAINVGTYHTTVLADDGNVYTCGHGGAGALGTGGSDQEPLLAGLDRSGMLAGKTVLSVAAGMNHTLVLAVGTSFPKVVSVEVPADGFYNAGKVLSFRVTFETAVSVVCPPGGNAPSLDFTVGGVPHQAVCTTGSNTSSLLFKYTVQPGDNGIVELVATKIELNDGSIRDGENDDVEPELHGIPALTANVIVDTVPPTVQPASPVGPYTYRSPLDLGPVIVADEPLTAYGATGLPTGLSVNATTGAISGTPTQAGEFAAAIQATDRAGNTGSGILSLVIEPVALMIDTGATGLRAPDKTYDGTPEATLVTSTAKLLRALPGGGLTDSLWGDDVTLAWAGAVAVFEDEIVDGAVGTRGKDAGTHKPVAVTTPPTLAGRNAANPKGPNYVLAPIPTLFANVLPRHVTVVADNQRRGFGMANPPLTWSVENAVFTDVQTGGSAGTTDYSGVLSGEPVLTTVAMTKTPPGDYPIRLELGSLEPTGNYAFADPKIRDGTLTIEPAPIVISVLRHDPRKLTPSEDRVIWAVQFNLPVTGVDLGDFVLTATGSAMGRIVSVEPGATIGVWLVTVDSLAGSGALRLDVKGSGTGIRDATGYDLHGGFYSGQIYVLGGTMATFGRNNNGQLGTPVENTPWSAIPILVVDNNSVLNDLTIAAVAAGQAHSLAIGSDGRVYAWGFNNYGQLGIGTVAPMTYAAPERVVNLPETPIVAVAAGWAHSVALDEQGRVYTWGGNDAGQLGLGSTGDPRPTPSLVTALSGKTIIAIAAGHSHSLALASDGTLHAWGRNDFGQLGVQQNDQTLRTKPTPVFSGSGGAMYGRTVVAIAAGYRHSLALTADGTAYAWGDNTEGQLGSGGDFVSHTVPWPVLVAPGSALEDVWLVAIASGCVAFHNVAIAADGRCFAWGRNDHGQLGTGDATIGRPSNEPMPVAASGVLAGRKTVAAAAGADFTVVHTGGTAAEGGGMAFSWGRNEYGELGSGDTAPSRVPLAVDRSSLLAHKEVIAVSAGADHTVALTADGPMIAIDSITGDDMLNREEALVSGFLVSGSTTYVEPGQSVTIRLVGETSPLLFTPIGAVQVTGDNVWATLAQRNVPGLVDGTYRATADVRDVLGSAAPRAQRRFVVDKIAPTLLTLSRHEPVVSPTNADELTFRAIFSEPVTGVDPDDWTVQGTTARVTVAPAPDGTGQVDGRTYDVTLTASADNDLAGLPSGLVVLGVKTAADGRSITDVAGNPLADTALTADCEFDNVPPTLVSIDRIFPLVSPSNADALTFRLAFSEPVVMQGEDFVVAGTTARVTLIQPAGDRAYDVTVAGDDLPGLNDTVELGFAIGHRIADLVGNLLTNTSVPDGNVDVRTCQLDNSRPTVTIGPPSVTLTRNGPVSLTITYADADFDACTLAVEDVVVHATGSATVGSIVISGTGNTREVTLADITGDGDVSISLAAGTARDRWGNLAPASGPSSTFTADNLAPAATIRRVTGPVATAASTVTYEVTYADPHLGVCSIDANRDVLLQPAPGVTVASKSVTGAGAVWRIELSGLQGDGTLGLALAPGTAVDVVGNSAAGATSADTVLVANNSPTLTSIERLTPNSQITNADILLFQLTFSTEVTLAPADFVVSGSSAIVARITPEGGGVYDVEISGGNLADCEERVVLAISSDHTIEDAAGHPLIAIEPTGTNGNFFDLDNIPPDVAIGPPSPTATTTEDVSFEITYADEHLAGGSIGLAPAQVSLVKTGTANGGIAVAENGAGSRLVTITNVSGDGTLSIEIEAGSAVDAAGNPAPATGPSAAAVVGGGAPHVVSIMRSSPETSPTNADSVTFRVTFSEPVSQPVAGDFVVTFSPAGPTATVEVTDVVDDAGNPDAAGRYVTLSGEALVDLDDVLVTLDLSPTQTISDLSGNPLAGIVPPPGRGEDDENTYRFDNTAPIVAIDPIAGAVADLIDGRMISNGFEITGSGDAPDRPVTIYFEPAGGGGVTVYSQTAAPPWPVAHAWRVAVPADALATIPDGNYRVTVEVMDEAGNAAAAWRDPVVIDRTAPTVAIDPICEDSIAGAADLEAGFNITGTSEHLLPGETIVVAIGGRTYDAHPDGDGNWVVVITGVGALAMLADGGLVEGSNWVTADATDSAGHLAQQARAELVVRTQAPSLAINPIVGSGIDLIGAGDLAAGFVITGSSDAEGQPFTVYLDPAAAGSNPSSHLFRVGPEHSRWTDAGQWSATVEAGALDVPDGDGEPIFPDGEYRVTVEVADVAGNLTRRDRLFRIDRSLPEIAIDPISDGTVNPTEISDGFAITGTTLNVESGRTVTIAISRAGGVAFFESSDGQVTVSGLEGSPVGSWQLGAAIVQGLAGALAVDGEYVITATVSDAAGTAATASYSLVVDHTAPVLRILPEPPALIVLDTAALESPFPITGTCSESGGQLVITLAKAATPDLVVYTVSGGTTWTLPNRWSVSIPVGALADTEAFPDDDYVVTATLVDDSGNVATATHALRLDRLPPAISIDAISGGFVNGAEATAGFEITGATENVEVGCSITVTIADPNGVQLYASTQGLVTVSVSGGSPSGIWQLDANVVKALAPGFVLEGAYTVTAGVTDLSGVTASATRTFTFDRTSPSIRILPEPPAGIFIDDAAIASGFEIRGTGSEFGRIVEVTFAREENPGVVVYTVEGDTIWSDADQWRVSVPAAALENPAVFPDGRYTITATLTDAAGQIGRDEDGLTLDRAPPRIAIAAISGGDVNEMEILAGFEIGGATENVEPGRGVIVAIARAEGALLYESAPGVVLVAAEVGSAAGTWVLPAGDVRTLHAMFVDGDYTVTATTSDAFGTMVSASCTLKVDRTAPVITIGPISGDDMLNAAEAGVGLPISGTTSAEAGCIVKVTFDDVQYAGKVLSTAAGPDMRVWAIDPIVPKAHLATLLNQTYVVDATVTDAAGNPPTVHAERSLEVDKTAPALTIDPITDNQDNVLNAQEFSELEPGKIEFVRISGRTSNIEGGQRVTVAFNGKTYFGTVVVAEPAPAPGEPLLGTWQADLPWEAFYTNSATLARLPDGRYAVTADAMDVAGEKARQATDTLTIDTFAPRLGIDVIDGDDVVNRADYLERAELVVSGTAIGIEPGRPIVLTMLNSARVPVYSNSTAVAVWDPINSAIIWSLSIPHAELLGVLPDDEYIVRVEATTEAGREAEPCERSFVVDRKPVNGSDQEIAGTYGEPFSRLIDVVDDSPGMRDPEFRIVADALPPGLSLDADSGVVSGVPRQAGAFAARVEIRDAAGNPMTILLTVAISPAELTVTADRRTKVYGDDDPVLTYQVSGLKNDDTADAVLAGELEREPGESVGTYAIGQGTLAIAEGNTNYTLVFVGADLTITPAELTVIADSRAKVYGEVDPALTYEVSGLANGDSATVVLTGELTRQPGEAVGDYPIGQGTVALVEGNANYTLIYAGAELRITAAELTVSADPQSKSYGESDPAFTYQVSGLRNGDAADAVLTGELARQPGEAVGVYPIEQGTLAIIEGNSNYALIYIGAELTIAAAELTVTADPQTKIYGESDPEFTYRVEGLKNGDTATAVLVGALERQPGEVVGVYAIEQGSLSPVAGNANYTLVYVGADLTITAATLTVTADPQTKVYGDTDPELSYQVSGLKNGDAPDAVLTGALARQAGETVGTYPIEQGTLVVTAGNANYALAYVAANLTITAAELRILANDRTKTYGTRLDFFGKEFITEGLVGDDVVTRATLTSTGAEATATVTGNPYPIKISAAEGSGLENYAITYVEGELTVAPAVVRVSAKNQVRYYGDENPILSQRSDYLWEGFADWDTMDVARGPIAAIHAETANRTAPVGSTHPIRPDLSGLSADNYIFSVAEPAGLLTIEKRPLTLTLAGEKTYDGTRAPLNAVAAITDGTLADGENINFNLSDTSDSRVGTYTGILTATVWLGSVETTSNYTLIYAGEYHIMPRTLAVTLGGSKSYDGTPAPLNASGSITAGALALTEQIQFTFADTASAAVGSYAGLLSATVWFGQTETTSNYTLSYDGSYSIVPRPITVTLGGSKLYDGTRTPAGATSAVTAGVLADGETMTCHFADTSDPVVGTYAGLATAHIWRDGLESTGNYAIGYDGVFSIVVRPLVVTVAGSKVYDGTTAVTGASAVPHPGILPETGDVISFAFGHTTSPIAGPYANGPELTLVSIVNEHGDASGSYAIAYVGSYEITRRALTVTLGGFKLYDGTTVVRDATVSPPEGLIPQTGDTISYSFGPTNSADVGEYANSAALTIVAIHEPGGADVLGSYDFQYEGHYAIKKAPAIVTLVNLVQTYDGFQKAAGAITNPAGLTVAFTYNGGESLPVIPGVYAVVAAVDDLNYEGGAAGSMTIAVRAPVLAAPLEGVQTPEDRLSPPITLRRDDPFARFLSITEIVNGILYEDDTGRVLQVGDTVELLADGTAALAFSPAANLNSHRGDTFRFAARAALDAAGTASSLSVCAVPITVTEVPDTPFVPTGLVTTEDTLLGATKLLVTRNPFDSATVTHFKISDVRGGELRIFRGIDPNTGTPLPLVIQSTFITADEASNLPQGYGLKFMPAVDRNRLTDPAPDAFSFRVQAANGASDAAVLGDPVTVTISVMEVNDTPLASTVALGVVPAERPQSQATSVPVRTFAALSGEKPLAATRSDESFGSFAMSASAPDTLAGASSEAGLVVTIPISTLTQNGRAGPTTAADEIRTPAEGGQRIKVAQIQFNPARVASIAQPSSDSLQITLQPSVVALQVDAQNPENSDVAFRISDDGQSYLNGAIVDDAKNSAFRGVSLTLGEIPNGVSITPGFALEDTLSDTGLVIATIDPSVILYVVTDIRGGTLFKNSAHGGGQLNVNATITLAEGSAGLQFMPAANDYSPTTEFSVTIQGVSESGPIPDSVATAAVTVTPVNDSPVAYKAPEQGGLAITAEEDRAYVMSTDDFGFTDPADEPASHALSGVLITRLPPDNRGSLWLRNGADMEPVVQDVPIPAMKIEAGDLLYVPYPTNSHGTAYDSFDFRVRDQGGIENGGADLSGSSTMNVHVLSVNDPPIGEDGTVSTSVLGVYVFGQEDFAFSDPNDTPPNGLRAIRITELPSKGVLALGPGGGTLPEVTLDDIVNRRLFYMSDPGARGTDSFKFRVTDDGGSERGGIDMDVSHRVMTLSITPGFHAADYRGGPLETAFKNPNSRIDGPEVNRFVRLYKSKDPGTGVRTGSYGLIEPSIENPDGFVIGGFTSTGFHSGDYRGGPNGLAFADPNGRIDGPEVNRLVRLYKAKDPVSGVRTGGYHAIEEGSTENPDGFALGPSP